MLAHSVCAYSAFMCVFCLYVTFDLIFLHIAVAPGGTRIDDGDKTKVTKHCVFTVEESHAALRSYAQVCGTTLLSQAFRTL